MSERLARLTPEAFQDLAAALVLAEYGARAQKMGRGRDGGRDLLLRQPRDSKSNGAFTVFQVKHKAASTHSGVMSAGWVIEQLRGELEAWVYQVGARRNIPSQFVFITNVELTPFPDRGGYDRVTKFLSDYLEKLRLRVKGELMGPALVERVRLLRRADWQFWDGTQVEGLIDAHSSVRAAFPALLTAGDVLNSLSGVLEEVQPGSIQSALNAHARTVFTSEGNVYFDEAGAVDGRGYPLHEVIVDLPLADGMPSLLSQVKSRAEHMLRPSSTSFDGPRHLVVAGAPGNGKTTISRFLVQAFRAAFLRGSVELSRDHEAAIGYIDAALQRLGLSAPRHRRWPLRIDLGEFAERGASGGEGSLMRWAAEQISRRSDQGRVTATSLKTWIRQWPALIILDGLDEVTEPSVRRNTIERIVELVNDAEAEDCDLLVLVTTRPMGYTENIAPTMFERVDLGYFEPSDAVDYGTNAARVRIGGDHERHRRVVARLTEAAADAQRAHLLRTPLQVLILTIILDGQGYLDPDRYGLFWGYYNAVLKREREKPGPTGKLLREHDDLVERLHEHVGLELHRRSELPDSPNATVDDRELRDLGWQIMARHGFDPGRKHADLLGRIVEATTRRLVLLAPQEHAAGYGFDVRSLQELMAARCLSNNDFEVTERNLHAMAASPHWRNAWLFIAGRIFSEPRHGDRDRLVTLLENVDGAAHGRLGASVPIAPWLAFDVLDDGMCRSMPRWRDRIAEVALLAIALPHDSLMRATGEPLVALAESSDELRDVIVAGLSRALNSTGVERQNAERIKAWLEERGRQRMLGKGGLALRALRSESGAGAGQIAATADGSPMQALLKDDRVPASQKGAASRLWAARHAFFEPSDRAEIFSLIVSGEHLEPLDVFMMVPARQEPGIGTQLRQFLEKEVYRLPVGSALVTELH